MNINLLPEKNRKELILAQFNKVWAKVKSSFPSKQTRYKLASVLDVFLILLILTNGIKPAQRLIEPLVSPLNNVVSSAQTPKEVFSFVPGLAQNKFDSIDLSGLNTLAFFDVPVTSNGDINTDSRGYNSFKSDNSVALFQKAQTNGVKVLLTLTLTDNGDIKSVLDSPDAQKRLIDQSISEVQSSSIDGVNIDFEPVGNWVSPYSSKLPKFLSDLRDAMHQAVPNSVVAVSVPSNGMLKSNGLNYSALASSTDKLMVISSDQVVPEEKDNQFIKPIFGYQAQDYFHDLSVRLVSFIRRVPEDKLVYERAWYGNGDQYPLYQPSSKPNTSVSVEDDSGVNSSVINKLVSDVPDNAKEAAKKNLPYIIQALKDEHILNPNVLSYAMATIEHETDSTFEPIEEIGGRESARRLGYEGGEDYFGRGFIQLTHLRNYLTMGERIGMGDALAKNPDLASTPEVAAKVLAAFFKDNNVASLASEGDFIDARAPINPDYNGYKVAMLAQKYEDSF